MIEKKAVMFLYGISPVHMGAGTALGAIDNPIQRERHTNHPMIAGSGLKGALRHDANGSWNDAGLVSKVFGPDPDSEEASEHAGSLSLSDAQLVLFPVRSLHKSFVYATSPTALARLKRLLEVAGLKLDWAVPEPKEPRQAMTLDDAVAGGKKGKLVLESFDFDIEKTDGDLAKAASFLAENAIGGETAYFKQKVKTDLVLLHDDRFNYFVNNATIVEPHVRIDDATGTAQDGGLFYTECLPPESLLASLIMASAVRRGRKKDAQQTEDAAFVLEQVAKFDGTLVQVGGDATTGRGQMLVRCAGMGGSDA